MPHRELLHQEVEANASASWRSQSIMHAMIDCGQITDWTCQAERCLLPEVPVDITTSKTRASAHIDHRIERHRGGSHRPGNLRLVHHACNSARTWHGRNHSPEHVAKIKVNKAARAAAAGPCPKCDRTFRDVALHVQGCDGVHLPCGHLLIEAWLKPRQRWDCRACHREQERARKARGTAASR